jgi:hypothetical protein
MSDFVLTRRIDLSDLSDEWKGCYIKINDITFEDVMVKFPKFEDMEDGSKEQVDMIESIIKDALIEGKGWNGKEKIDITKENVRQLPKSVITKVFGFLSNA